jgi:hypothetical protein
LVAGTRTSSKASSWVSEAHQPTLEYPGRTVRPGVPVGTRIVDSSLLPLRSPVTAATAMTAVMSVPELVMNALLPLMTHSSAASSSTARVCAPPASEPNPGSVNPNAASASPLTSRGSQVSFCCSVPNR